MNTTSKKFEFGIVIVALLALALVWAVNGYEDTWLYVTAAIIAIPTSWWYVSKN